jgi:hypothetical protein
MRSSNRSRPGQSNSLSDRVAAADDEVPAALAERLAEIGKSVDQERGPVRCGIRPNDAVVNDE